MGGLSRHPPYAGDHYNTGRETFLMPVAWEDGWPVITCGEQTVPYIHKRPALPRQAPAPLPLSGNFIHRDEFDNPQLPLHWLQLRQPDETPWYRLDLYPGSLALTPRAASLGDQRNPTFLARRQQHLNATAITQMRISGDPAREHSAGMAVFQNARHFYFLGAEYTADQSPVLVVRRRNGGGDKRGEIVARHRLNTPPTNALELQLRITARGGEYDFHYRLGDTGSPGNDWQPLLLAADGRVVSTRNAGGFVGALIGLHAYSGD